MTDAEAKRIYAQAAADCLQDHCENVPFACIGGLAARPCPQAPNWIKGCHAAHYVKAYCKKAEELYGANWKTVTFSWRPALIINAGSRKVT